MAWPTGIIGGLPDIVGESAKGGGTSLFLAPGVGMPQVLNQALLDNANQANANLQAQLAQLKAAMAQQGQGQSFAAPMQVPGLLPNQQVVPGPSQWSGRRQFAPLTTAAVTLGAGAATSLSIRPQRPFRVERLIIQGTVPGDLAGLAVADIKVGATSQFVNGGLLPAYFFDTLAFDANVRFDSSNPGVDITVSINNIGAAPVTFVAGFVGTSLEGQT